MNEMSKRVLVWGLVLVVYLVSVVVLLSQPERVRGEVTTYSDGVPTTEPLPVVRREYKWKIRRVHEKIRFRKLEPEGRQRSGACYRVDAKVIGDNSLIDEIVSGTMHVHWCVRAGDVHAIFDKYTYANRNYHLSWGWGLDSVGVVKGAGWSTKWCLEDGEVGPCPATVEYRYFRYTFRFERGIDVFGQELKWHKNLFVACTVRGDPGGFLCSTGEAR